MRIFTLLLSTTARGAAMGVVIGVALAFASYAFMTRDAKVPGVVLQHVVGQSPYQAIGLRSGDRITSVHQRTNQTLVIDIERDGRAHTIFYRGEQAPLLLSLQKELL